MDAIDLCLDISPVTHFAYGQTFARVRDGINEFSANIIQFGRLFMAKSSQASGLLPLQHATAVHMWQMTASWLFCWSLKILAYQLRVQSI